MGHFLNMTAKGSMWLSAVILAILVCSSRAEQEVEEESERAGKLLPIFQVVRFPNDICSGTSRNGTCYTAEECSTKGGTNDGTCASGFGVCCICKFIVIKFHICCIYQSYFTYIAYH